MVGKTGKRHFRTGCPEGLFGIQRFVWDTLNSKEQFDTNEMLGSGEVNESVLGERTSLHLSVWEA